MSELQVCNLLDMSVWFEVHEMLNRRVSLKDTLVTLGVVSPNELMYVHNQCMIENRRKIVENHRKIVENHYRIVLESIKNCCFFQMQQCAKNLCRRCVAFRPCSEITPCKLSQRTSSYGEHLLKR